MNAKELAQEWLRYDKFQNTRTEIQKLLDENNEKELLNRLSKRIDFGTAGLRGRMAAGFACMNELIVVQTTQGLCKYVEEKIEDCKQKGIVVGFDGRYNSKKFAELIASVFVSQGFKVYLFPEMVPTPSVPFAIRQLHTAAGVMVTASHNPKQDNGYKLYWSNGSQIIEPHDKEITKSIMKNLEIWDGVDITCQSIYKSSLLIQEPLNKLIEKYFEMSSNLYCWEREQNKTSDLKIVYTAMHGVGASWIKRIFEAFSLPECIVVKEQNDPDPEFSTVQYPNPEEGKGSLKLAIETAEKNGCKLILANDPDADRLAVAEKQKNGEWRVLNGNEIALLFAHWTWTHFVKQNPNADKKKCVMISSTVSSKILGSMAKHEGFTWQDTLTGFKWIGNKAYDFLQEGYTFLFGFEVEIGFLVGDISLDKDGVRTAAIFAEMANTIYKTTESLTDYLETLYQKYGFYLMRTRYFFTPSIDVLNQVFSELRTLENGGYPKSCGPFKIKYVRDLTVGYDNSQPDNKPILPVNATSQMITFTFEDGSSCTLRNSGTEPKLKWYVEVVGESREATSEKLNALTKTMIDTFLQPEKHGLIPPKDE